jgi:hypothetical protein
MATVIQIKRSTSATAPVIANLAEGELAYVQDRSGDGASAKLFIESVDSGANPVIHAIGGKYYTDILDGASTAPANLSVGNGDTSGGSLKLLEDSDNGTNFTALKAADSLAASVTFTLPAADGTSGQVLGTDASGNLSFISTTSTIGGASDTNFSSLADGHVAIYDADTSMWLNKAVSGDVTMADTGAFTLGADVVDGTNIADDSIDSEHLADGSIDPAHFAADAVNAAALASNAVVFASVDGAAVITAAEGVSSNSTSDVTFPTTKAVFDYVSAIDVDDALALAGDSGTGSIDLDTQSLTVTGGTGVTSSASGQAITLAIGQDVSTSSNVTFGNITTTGYIAGPASMTIDPAAVGDDTGTLIIAGNLQVDGTTTTINSTTVELDDLNFEVAAAAADSAAANGAGFTVGGALATLTYAHADTSWNMNKGLNITGGLSLTGSITSVDGAAPTAGQLMVGNGSNGDMELATLTAGEGMDVTNADGAITLSVEDATDSNKGIASFASAIFDVSSGAVSIKDATSSVKGIASFGRDFTVTSGAVAVTSLDGGTF